ncbi:MAG: hypothetical protein HYU75_23660, partial [Betaproteobacteria bacterium]|nr:hypothetical protein [Betaproteobacteria bacterium]
MSGRLPICLVLAALLAAACATGRNAVREAESLIGSGRYEEGLAMLQSAPREGEEAMEVREALIRNRSLIAERIDREARLALDSERPDDAERLYNRLLSIDPNSSQAKAGMERVRSLRDRAERVARVEELLRKGDLAGAERGVRAVLRQAPKHRKALALAAQISERQRKGSPLSPELGPEFKKQISLEFREVNLRSVFDAIWHASGVNFILDRDVRSDVKVSIFVSDIPVIEAIDSLLMTQQLARKVVSSKTLFVFPKTPQKLSEYQDLVVRNFFLAHADPKQMLALLKTILRIKDVFIDEKRNLVVIRDTQEQVDLADKLIRAQDQADPEVMLALDVIEIKRSKLSEIGLVFPSQITLGVGSPISAQALRDLNAAGVSVGFGGIGGGGAGNVVQLNLQRSDGDANTLANPRIRVRNREKAKIHIGDRLPVVTTTSSSVSTFVGQTVNYLEVGLKLEVEPQVMLDDDVIIKLSLDVSSATQSKVNTGFYDVGTRNTSTVLTIKDGETQILAGLIRDDEIQSAIRFPGLGDIPILGRLFSSEHREKNKTEIILAITPQIIRNLARPESDLAEYPAGTESGRPAVATPSVPPRPAPPRPAPPRPGAVFPGAPAGV